MTEQSESLKAAIAEVDAANPAKEAAPEPKKQPETETPAEQGTTAETVEETEETEDSATSDGSDAPAQRQNKGVGKRINELTREKYEERRAREQAERERDELKAQLAQKAPKQPAQAEQTDRPKLEDFDFDADAHAEAVAEWKYRKLRDEEKSTAAAKQAEDAFQARIKDVDPAEWQEAITAPVNYTRAMLEVIGASEKGPHVAVYLARNLDEADQISRMSDFHAAAALGRIEAKLAAPASAPPPSPPKTVTRAPAPAPTVQGTAVVSKSANEKSVDDFIADIRGKAQR